MKKLLKQNTKYQVMKYNFEEQSNRGNTTAISISVVALVALFAFLYFFTGVFGNTKINLTLKTNPDLEDGLVGHYTFDGVQSTQITDRSGNDKYGYLYTSGEATSTKTVRGKIGQALEFDGSNDFVLIEDSANIMETTDEFTVGAWVYIPASITTDATIYAAGSDYDGYWHLVIDNTSDQIGVRIDETGTVHKSTKSVAVGTWQHVLVKKETGSSNVAFYLNGEFDRSRDIATTSPTSINDKVIGAAYEGGSSQLRFPGLIDDLRIYNRVLATSSIERLYQLGATTKVNTTIKTNPDLENGLVGHWTFDGSVSTSIADKGSGNNLGYFGTSSRATSTIVVAGAIGQGIELDGIGDFVRIEDAASLRPGTGDWSTAFWVKGKDEDQTREILNKRLGSGTYNMWLLAAGSINGGGDLDASRKVTLLIIEESGADDWWSYTNDDVMTGEWKHVIAVREGTSNPKVYIDGELAGMTIIRNQGTKPYNINNTEPWNIGYDDDLNSDNFDGRIDDLRFYNRALSTAEVKRLYELGATTKVNTTIKTNPDLEDGLELHYTLDGPDVDLSASAGTQVRDRSGNARHGGWEGTAPTEVIGKIGQGLDFNPSNNDSFYKSEFSESESSPITVAAWFKAEDGSGSGDKAIFSKSRSGFEQWYLGWDKTNDDLFFRVDASATPYWAVTDDAFYADGQWHHVAGVWDGSTIQIYLDGVAGDSTPPSVTGSMDNQDENLCIGAEFTGSACSNDELGERIDDVRLYSRALTDAEILRLYQLGN